MYSLFALCYNVVKFYVSTGNSSSGGGGVIPRKCTSPPPPPVELHCSVSASFFDWCCSFSFNVSRWLPLLRAASGLVASGSWLAPAPGPTTARAPLAYNQFKCASVHCEAKFALAKSLCVCMPAIKLDNWAILQHDATWHFHMLLLPLLLLVVNFSRCKMMQVSLSMLLFFHSLGLFAFLHRSFIIFIAPEWDIGLI